MCSSIYLRAEKREALLIFGTRSPASSVSLSRQKVDPAASGRLTTPPQAAQEPRVRERAYARSLRWQA